MTETEQGQTQAREGVPGDRGGGEGDVFFLTMTASTNVETLHPARKTLVSAGSLPENRLRRGELSTPELGVGASDGKTRETLTSCRGFLFRVGPRARARDTLERRHPAEGSSAKCDPPLAQQRSRG